MSIKIILKKKKLISFISLILIALGGYFIYKALSQEDDGLHYATAAIEKGTIISLVSGSGQVLATNQVDIKSKASGDIIYLNMVKGQEVSSGTVLAQIDSGDAMSKLRNAEIDLETAELELTELLKPVAELDLLKAENNLQEAKQIKQKAEDKISQGLEDAFNQVSDAFLNLPDVMTGLNAVLYSSDIAKSELAVTEGMSNYSALLNSIQSSEDYDEFENYVDKARDNYRIAKSKYETSFKNYQEASRYSSQEEIKELLDESIEAARAMSESIKSMINMIDWWVDYRSGRDFVIYNRVEGYQTDLISYTSIVNSHLSALLSVERSLQDNEEAVLDAERSIKELELSLKELKAGADELAIRAKEINIQQKKDALLEAQQDLADYYIKAPFDGIVAQVDVKKGENVSSNSVVAVMITQQKIAEISLNEVDVAQVEVNQKATLTFDAIEDLAISGQVAEIDALGTITQGVVTYDVKIAFDTQDEGVKPNMSVSANIITASKQNVLIVSSAAVKYQGDVQYVEMMDAQGLVHTQVVELGISNDTQSEVLSGLVEGDKVITQTIETASNSASSNSFQDRGPGQAQMMRMMR